VWALAELAGELGVAPVPQPFVMQVDVRGLGVRAWQQAAPSACMPIATTPAAYRRPLAQPVRDVAASSATANAMASTGMASVQYRGPKHHPAHHAE
jgi:hypothetical protein